MKDHSSNLRPKWQQDFPVESERDDYITRRDFTRFMLLVSAGFAVGNGWIWSKTGETARALSHQPLDLGSVEDLKPGSWKVFHYPDKHHPAVLIRRVNGEFAAFSQKCTHLACPVAYERSGNDEQIVCHCHNGRFDVTTGEGVAGPPRELRPLQRVALVLRDGRVIATGLEKELKHG